MLQFTKGQKVVGGQVYIPYQMRAALALHSGTELFLTLSSTASAGELLNQLVVSPTPHSKQSDLWTLKVVFRDRPGIAAELTELLWQMDIDIVDFRCATRKQQQELVVHATLDAEYYFSEFDGNTGTRRENSRIWPRELYARLLALFIEDLSFRPDGKPNVFLIRNYVLRDSLDTNTERHSVSLAEGCAKVPHAILQKVKESFKAEYSLRYPSGRRVPMLCHLCIDSSYRVLLATFYFRNTGHLHLRVRASNQVGAIARVTRAISNAGFNILQSNCRDLSSHVALNDLLLRLPPEVDRFRDDRKLKAYARGILTDASLSDLNTKITFPRLMSQTDISRDEGGM